MKINKYALNIVFFLLCLSSFSQPITFNKVYNPYNKNTNTLGVAILDKGNGYIAVSVGSDTVNVNRNNIIINEIDSVGKLTK